MKKSRTSAKANGLWSKAVALQRRINTEVEKEWLLLKSIQGARVRRSFNTFMAAGPLEFLLLAVFVIPITQLALLELVDDDNPIVLIFGILIVAAVMAILHFLVSRSALVFGMYRPDEVWAEEYAPFAGKERRLLNPIVLSHPPSVVEKWVFGILTPATFIFLAYLRTLVLVTEYEHISNDNLLDYLFSALFSLIILGVLLYTVPGFNIGYRAWRVEQKINRLRRHRDTALQGFRREATSVEDRMDRAGDYFAPFHMTEEDRICLDRLQELRQDNGTLECLVPKQRLQIVAYFEGVAAPGLQIRALTREQIPLTSITDPTGKAELRWTAFDRNLAYLAVGNKEMFDVNVPDRVPQIIELTTPDRPQPPRLENRA